MHRILIVIVAIVIVVGSGGPGVAQEESATAGAKPIGGLAFVDEIELTVVNLLVYVTDEDGRAVTELSAEDFRISMDGSQRQISNFDLYTDEIVRHRLEAQEQQPVPPTADETGTELPEVRPVYVVIYIDNDNLRPLDRNRVMRQLRPFIREHLRPPVQMMVVSYQKSLRVEQPFSSNPEEILGALHGIRMMTGGRESRESSRKDILDRMRRYAQDAGESSVQSASRVNAEMIGFAENEANDLSFTISALRQTVTTLSGLPGKKMLLYVSNGLPMVAGLDLFYAFANAYNQPSVLTLSAQYEQTRQFQSLVAAANAQDVSIYAVDAAGLKNAAMSTAEYAGPVDTVSASVGEQNYMDSLRFMASNTGGAAILNTNDISQHLDKVSQDFFTYYSLGFPLNMSGSDKVHRIKVELPNHPQYELRYRRRFVEKSTESRVQDKVITALMFPVDDNPLQLDCSTTTPAPATEDRWIVPYQISFPLRKVALMPEGSDYVGRVVLFIAARDTDGKQSDLVRQEHEVRVPAANYEEAQRRRFVIDASLLMEAGSYTVATALLDQITRQSAYQTMSVVVHGD